MPGTPQPKQSAEGNANQANNRNGIAKGNPVSKEKTTASKDGTTPSGSEVQIRKARSKSKSRTRRSGSTSRNAKAGAPRKKHSGRKFRSRSGLRHRASNEQRAMENNENGFLINDRMQRDDTYTDIMANNAPPGTILAPIYDDDDGANHDLDSEKEFDNFSDYALSPDEETPPVSDDEVELAALNMTVGDNKQRELWHWGAVVATCVHFGSCLHMPLLAIGNGGYAFLFQVFACMASVGWPMAAMEIWLGQYTSRNGGHLFTAMAPVLGGLRFVFPVIRMLRLVLARIDVLTGVILNDIVFAIVFGERRFSCLGRGKYCRIGDEELEEYCPMRVEGECVSRKGNPGEMDLAIHGRQFVASQPTPNLHPLEEMSRAFNPEMVRMGIILIGIVYVVLSLQRVNFSRAAAVFALVPLAAWTIVFGGLSTNFELNLSMYTDWMTLFSPRSWILAFFVCAEILSLGDGTLSDLGSMMPFNYNTYKALIPLVVVSALMPVMSTLMMIPFAQHRWVDSSRMLWQETGRYAGLDLYVKVSTQESLSSKEPAFIIFLMAVYLSQVYYVVSAIQSISDMIVIRIGVLDVAMKEVIQHSTRILLSLVSVYGAICCYRSPSPYLFYEKAMAFCMPCVLFTEAVAVTGSYGFTRVFVNIRTIVGEHNVLHHHIQRLLKPFWVFITPVVCMSVIVMCVVTRFDGSLWILIPTTLLPCFVVIFGMIQLIVRYMKHERPSGILQVQNAWGPLKKGQRAMAHYDEMASRIFD